MTKNKKLRVAVLLSGNGSNLQALIDDIEANKRETEIVIVVSNNPDAFGLERASKSNIPTIVVNHHDHPTRQDYDTALKTVLDEYQPDLIVLAGFMRILSDDFVNRYHGKMINIHPSLLPKYKGLNTHQRAIDAGDVEHGASVHFVTPELDDGPVIMQAKVPVLKNDDAHSLAQRVHQVEHIIYPMAVNLFAEERIVLHDGNIILDEQPITPAQQMVQLT